MRLGFHPEAVAELREAAFWYDEHRAGLGDEFVNEVNEQAERIAASSTAYLVWPGSPLPHPLVRRALVERFPYAIAFEVREQEVLILAVAHVKRRPLYWIRRVRQGPAERRRLFVALSRDKESVELNTRWRGGASLSNPLGVSITRS